MWQKRRNRRSGRRTASVEPLRNAGYPFHLLWAGRSEHFDIVGQNRQGGRLHDYMLGELFGVVATDKPLEDHAFVSQEQPEALNPAGQLALHPGLDLLEG